MEEWRTARAPAIARKVLGIDNRIAEGAAFLGEPFLLVQAIGNLLDNALDFTPAHGTVVIEADLVGGVWRLTVTNSGSAIPDYARERLFERFYLLPRSDTGRKSTGLGLAFVREVAQLHGGTITVDNMPDAAGTIIGVTAQLCLPAA